MDKVKTDEYAAQLFNHPSKTIADLGIHFGVFFSHIGNI